MEIDHTCANPACNCLVENKGDYCSETCREGDTGHKEAGCRCGHGDCGTSTPETRGVPDQNG